MATPKLSQLPQVPQERGRRSAPNLAAWPRLMRAETAAAYVDEKSVETFRRGVGTIYPLPEKIPGKGDRWLKDAMDQSIDRLSGRAEAIRDAADVL
jgi:hypothetical protein